MSSFGLSAALAICKFLVHFFCFPFAAVYIGDSKGKAE